jgi:ElaB/YqjD/DUF883 family membrane-anchored ribosome-binding protein
MKNRIAENHLAGSARVKTMLPASADLLHTAQKKLAAGRTVIERYVQGYPAVSIGAALCIGVLIGWISKRR